MIDSKLPTSSFKGVKKRKSKSNLSFFTNSSATKEQSLISKMRNALHNTK